MCNETKVITNNGDVTSSESKKTLSPPDCAGSIETPFGVHYINRGDALDHAYMRSKQLSSLLLLMQVNDGGHFRLLNQPAQDSLMWFVYQLAKETGAMFDIVVADLAGGQQ